MAFRYINPGYAALLADSGAETVLSTISNPYNGVAFTGSGKYFTIIPAGKFSSADFYCRFNLYRPTTGDTGALFGLGMVDSDSLNSESPFAGIRCQYGNLYLRFGGYNIKSGISFAMNSVFDIMFAFHTADSTFELTVNGEKFTGSNSNIGYYKAWYNAASPIRIFFPATTTPFYVSNLIISSEEISPKEKIISLPTGATFTDMAAGASGLYIADAANQTLLQSVNVAELIENFGASSTITGVAVAGIPAYKTAEGLATLISLSKSGGSVVEHGSCSLSSDSAAGVVDSWGLSGVTIADLAGMQFGWKVGE